MVAAGVDQFTFHVEVTSLGSDLTAFIEKIKSKNIKVGLAIKPGYVSAYQVMSMPV